MVWNNSNFVIYKRGQSAIIVTILLILLVLASIVVLSNVNNTFLDKSLSEVSVNQFTNKIEIVDKSIKYGDIEKNQGNIIFTVRNLGKDKISSLTIILENDNGEGYNYEHEDVINSLDSENFNINYRDQLEGYVKKIIIYSINGDKRATMPTVNVINDGDNIKDYNLLDSSTWILGSTGSQLGFFKNGGESENSIILGDGPGGDEVILWSGGNDEISNADGGWSTNFFEIDNTKTYRYSVWVKKINSQDGSIYLGAIGGDGDKELLRLDNSIITNPYFFIGDLPSLNKWYLLTAYIHPHDYDSNAILAGMYDPEIGERIPNRFSDFKFSINSGRQIHRVYLYYDENVDDRVYLYDPRVDIIDGTEPSIEELLS